jgi:hypothetical protein
MAFDPEWIIPEQYCDKTIRNFQDNVNTLICEHNWRLNEIYTLPVGLRRYHIDLINNRIKERQEQEKSSQKNKKRK